MTPEEWMATLLEYPDQKWVERPREEVVDAIRAAVAEEAARWQEATRHEVGCQWVRSSFVPCTCGVNAQLAILHAEQAARLRA